METALKLGLEREAYVKLVPARYGLLMQLGKDKAFSNEQHREVVILPTKQKAEDLKNWCQPIPPYNNDTGAWIVPSDYEARDGSRLVRVYILTNPDDPKAWEGARASVFRRMFSPVDPGGNFEKGGLGINEHDFFFQNYFDKSRFQYSTHYARWYFCGPGGGTRCSEAPSGALAHKRSLWS